MSGVVLRAADQALTPVQAGISKRVAVDTPSLLVAQIFADEGAQTSVHGHAEDQAACVVSGQFAIRSDDGETTLGPGDGYSIPAGFQHGIRCVSQGSYILVTARLTGEKGHDHEHGPGHSH